MSWKYPEHPLKNGNVVGIDDINRNLTEFAEEVDGGLNEHNWERDSFVRSDCADDVSIEVWKNSVKQDPSINYMDTIEEFSQLRQIPAWSPVKSASYSASETITTGSCVLWIMYTGQHRQASGGFNEGIAQFAIRVNGTIIPETITGSASSSRDVVHHESRDAKSPFPGIAANRPHTAVVFGAGINHRFRSVALDAIVEVGAGTHTIEVCARLYAAEGPAPVYMVQGARDLIIVALRK